MCVSQNKQPYNFTEFSMTFKVLYYFVWIFDYFKRFLDDFIDKSVCFLKFAS